MPQSRTLFGYVLREVTLYTALGFVAFAAILIAQNLLRRLEDLVAVGFVARDAWTVVACLFPMLSAYAVPVAFLFGVLVAVGRLASDSEIKAMRACGLGQAALLTPVLALALLVSVGTAVLIVQVEPAARLRLRAVLKDVASRGAILEPGTFRNLAGRVIYVQERDTENRLTGVFVADRSDPQRPFVIVAESGRFRFDPERVEIVLELEQGDLHLDPRGDDEERHRRIAFERFHYAIDATTLLDEARTPRPNEMTFGELRTVLAQTEADTLPPEARRRDPNHYRVQIHRRLALPFAPLVFALLAVPLAQRRTRGARSWGTMLCVLLVVAYYALLSLGISLGQTGTLPAAATLWIPNLTFAAVAVPLLLRTRRGET